MPYNLKKIRNISIDDVIGDYAIINLDLTKMH